LTDELKRVQNIAAVRNSELDNVEHVLSQKQSEVTTLQQQCDVLFGMIEKARNARGSAVATASQLAYDTESLQAQIAKL
jgi:hypothetical protein